MSVQSLNDITSIPVESLKNILTCNRRMFSKYDLPEVYRAILSCCSGVMKNVKVGLLIRIDYESREITVIEASGIPKKSLKNTVLMIDECFTGKMIHFGNKQISKDVTEIYDFIGAKYVFENKIKILIALPLLITGKITYILNIYISESNTITTAENAFLDLFAGHAAAAIQHALFVQSKKHTLDDIGSILNIAKGITSSLELEQVIENILKAAQKIGDTPIASLWYRDIVTKSWQHKIPAELKSHKPNLPNIEEGEGIIGEVLRTGQPYHCPDTSQDPRFYPTWQDGGSEIVFPLIFENEVKGILNIESNQLNGFSAQRQKLLSMLAEEAVIALKNAQLYIIAERKTRQFNLLKGISEALSQWKSLPEILALIARESLDIVGHGERVAHVFLEDEEKNMLEIRAAVGELFDEKHLRHHLLLSEKSVVTWVVQHGQPRLIPDVSKSPDYLRIIPTVKSEVCVPLIFQNKVIGVINVESSQLNGFDERDKELLITIADNAAIATKIAELYDIRLKHLEALTTSANRINSSINLQELLITIANEALNAIGPDKRTLYVQLLDEKTQILEIKIAAGVYSSRNYMGIKLSIDEGISGWVLRKQRPYLCSNVKNNSFYYEVNPSVKSELCVPIQFGGRITGLLNIESLVENDFGQHDLQLLEGLANQAGVALENARLSAGLANTQYKLTQAQDLAVVGETLAGLTHDIRTCFSLISGDAQWIELQVKKNTISIKEIIEAMQNIQSHVSKVEKLTEDLNRKSQQLPPEFEQVWLGDVLKDVVYLMTNEAARSKVHIKIDDRTLRFAADLDIIKIHRVFMNITSNALDAMPDGGQLTISGKKSPEQFEISFSDTGRGIPKNNLPKVLNRFYTTKDDGFGLGLTICRRIVEDDHNGEINIISEENKGTTVNIRLPLRKKTTT